MASEHDNSIESLLEQRARFEQWLTKLDSTADKAPPAVRQKVRADYEVRLRGVIEHLRGHAATIAEELHRHQARPGRSRLPAEERRGAVVRSGSALHGGRVRRRRVAPDQRGKRAYAQWAAGSAQDGGEGDLPPGRSAGTYLRAGQAAPSPPPPPAPVEDVIERSPPPPAPPPPADPVAEAPAPQRSAPRPAAAVPAGARARFAGRRAGLPQVGGGRRGQARSPTPPQQPGPAAAPRPPAPWRPPRRPSPRRQGRRPGRGQDAQVRRVRDPQPADRVVLRAVRSRVGGDLTGSGEKSGKSER